MAVIWIPDILDNIARFLSPNEVSCTLRLVNKAAGAHFRGQALVVQLSLPVPQHAFLQKWESEYLFRPYTLRQRHAFLRLVAASGCIANLDAALALAGCVLTVRDDAQLQSFCPVVELIAAAAAAGHHGVVYWLRRRGCPWGTALAAAAGAGHLVTCKWLISAGCPATPDALTAAARAGHQDVCDFFLHTGDWHWDEAAVCAAADGGHVELMHSLLQHPRRPGGLSNEHVNWHGLAAAAARGCDLATLQHLHSIWAAQADSMNDAATAAAQDRAMALRDVFAAAIESPAPSWRAKVEWLRDLGCRCDAAVFSHVAAGLPDAVERLEWLRQAGCTLDACALRRGAAAGNTAAVRFLMALGLRPPRGAFEDAAESGHLEALQVLFSVGQGEGNATAALRAAARGGHLLIVAWLVSALGLDVAAPHMPASEPDTVLGCTFAVGGTRGSELRDWLVLRGCTWALSDFRIAAYHGNVEALEWLAEQGCISAGGFADRLLDAAFCHAAANGDLATLRCLRRLCFPWKPSSDIFTACLSHGAPLEALKWMFAAGCPLVMQHMVSELEGSRLSRVYSQEVLSWLDDIQRHLPDTDLEAVAALDVDAECSFAAGDGFGSGRGWRSLLRWKRRRMSPEVTLVAAGAVWKPGDVSSDGEEGLQGGDSVLRVAMRGLWGLVARAALPRCVFCGAPCRGRRRPRGDALEDADVREP